MVFKEKRIIVFGDSITAGAALKPGQKNWPEILGEMLDVEVLVRGLGGCNSNMALERWETEVSPYKADIIILEYGMNDHVIWADDKKAAVSEEQFRQNMQAMINMSKEKDAVPILVTPNRVIEEYYYTRHEPRFYSHVGGANCQIERFCEILRSLAKANDVSIADVFEETKKYDLHTLLRTPDNGEFEDGVHPYGEGIPFYAQALYQTIQKI